MVCVAASTCFRSIKVVVLAATETLPSKSTSLSKIDAVIADAVGLQIAMFVSTAVLPAGVVQSVVLDVAAAVRASALDTTAISNCTFLQMYAPIKVITSMDWVSTEIVPQVGTPPVTVNTCPVVPMPRFESVLVADA